VDTLVANASSSTILEVTAYDEHMNVVPNQSISLNIPANGGSTGTNPATTDASGQASFTLTSSTTVGVYNYTATHGTVDSNSVDLTFIASALDSLTLTVTGASSIVADGDSTTTLEVLALDEFANPLSGVEITLAVPADGGSVDDVTLTTNASGIVTYTLTSSTEIGLYEYTASHNAVTSNTENVEFTAGALASISLSVTGATSILADGTSTTELEATARDASNNLLNNIPITLNLPGSGGSVGTNPVNTNASGVATFTLTSSTTAGTYTYSASNGAVDSNTEDVTFTAGPLASLVLTTTGPTSILADGNATTNFQVLALDDFANPVPNVSVSITPPTNGGDIDPGSVDTNASGIASLILTSSTTTGLYEYRAQSGAILSNVNSVAFVAGPVDSLDLEVTGTSTLVANGTATTTLRVTAYDEFMNIVPNQSITLVLPEDGGSSSTNPATTNSSGQVSYTITASTTPGEYSYTATHGAITSSSVDLTFTPGSLSTLTLTVNGASSIEANGSATTSFEVLALDAFSNPVPGIEVTLAIPSNGGTVGDITKTTNASGLVSYTLTSSTVAGVYSYSASHDGTPSNSQDITFTPGALASISLSLLGNSTILADSFSTTELRATARDTFNNSISNESITLNIPSDGGTTPTNPLITNSSGHVEFTLTSSIVPGVYNFTASQGSLFSNTVPITFDELIVDTIELSLTGAATITADGTSSTSFEAMARDDVGDPVAGAMIALVIPTNGGSVDTNPLMTNASGIVTFTLTSSTIAGLYTFEAQTGAVSSNAENVTFAPGDIDSIELTVTGDSIIPADETSTTSFLAVAYDIHDNPIPGVSLTLEILANGGTTGANPVSTNASGQATWTLTSSLNPGLYSYTVTDGELNSNTRSVTFSPLAAAMEWDPDSHHFGTPNATVSHTFTITNTGGVATGALAVARVGGGGGGANKFSIVGAADNCNGVSLAPSESCTIDIQYVGTGNPRGNNQTATFEASATPGGAVSVIVQGNNP
jgi:adhesin/invasin